jgi:hypothetical protein
MLLGDANYEGSFLNDVIYRSATTCAYVEDILPGDVYIGWVFPIENQCVPNESINISYDSFGIQGCIPEHVYASWMSQIEKQCPLNESIDISDDSFDFSSEEIFEMGLELKQDDTAWYSLGDAVKFHEGTLDIREGVKNSLDVASSILSVGYYGFIIYTCPVSGVSLGALKILRAYGAFDNICNEDYSIMGYTACDVIEDTLVTHTLFSAGGKLAQTMFGVNPTSMQKISLGAAEKIIRKTAFSYSQMKAPDLTKAIDYAPNAAYVIASEFAKLATSATFPYPINVLICKSLGQVSRQLTKDWIKGEKSESYVEPVQKGVVSSVCKVFSDLAPKTVQPHLYNHCKETGKSIGNSLNPLLN